MYAKLAINNGKRSIKDYLIYFITITLCVSLFYAFMSLSSSDYEFITEDSYNFEMLTVILKYVTYIITALLILLIGYVNKYMIKRRQKEFATYILLGAEQRNVAVMFFIETLFIGLISVGIGIFIGMLFSQVVTALILITAKQQLTFSLRLYTDTVLITVIFFLAMFCIIGIFNIRSLSKVKLIDMINAEKRIEFQFKRGKTVYILLFILACVFYVICGYSVYKILKVIQNPNNINGYEKIYMLVGLITFILATYALFYSIAYIIIIVKNRWINFRYEGTNLFLIGSLVSKIKTAPMLMATTSITFLGAALSFTLTLLLSQWSLGYLEYRIPFDIIINSNYVKLRDINDIKIPNYKSLELYLEKQNYGVKECCEVEKYFLKEEDFYIKDKTKMPILAIKLSDFNKLRTMLGYEKITLKDNEFTIQCAKMINDLDIEKYIQENNVINVHGNNLKISSHGYYKDSIGEGIYSYYNDMLFILPDSYCEKLTLASVDFFVNTNKKISYEEALNLENKYIPNWSKNEYKDILQEYNNGEVLPNVSMTRIKVAEVSEILNVTLAMKILGVYLGTVLLMISFTVLALQQLIDSIEHKSRFNILKKLGIEEKEVNKIIFKQILFYFLLPIIVSTVEFIIFIYYYMNIFLNQMNVYIGDEAFVFNIGVAFFIIIIIYASYFLSTYYTFKRNINDMNKIK
ncbi:FtsX-like permease family protein [Clostridium senegalense]|uniref:ABC transporter permease n=1 Tax=Clostridium senegalense TaxID=1465809 RepID=A0A6M0GZN9_9CLOT|nr:ABC transporter permease [Clostridium senegalense]NEU03697.1 ABC transporter permease [Clostridium senegalense]